jgi:hypothetical protein
VRARLRTRPSSRSHTAVEILSRRCYGGPANSCAAVLRYFGSPPCTGAKRRDWGKAHADEARKVIADPTVLARSFTESVGIVESTSRNYQAFHPSGQTFGGSAD